MTTHTVTADDVLADIQRADAAMIHIRAELNRIARDLHAAVAVAAARQGISWDEAARRMLAMASVARLENCTNVIDAAREWGRGVGKR